MRSAPSTVSALVVATLSSTALAQHPPPPAPLPPPAQGQPAQGTYDSPPPQYNQSPPLYDPAPAPAPYAASAAPPPREAPPPIVYQAPEPPTHAPKYSLWVGGRVSYIGFGLHFFGNQANRSETTGNFVGNGIAPELNIGARISHRYIPYVFWEHGFLPAGHRFEGDSARASSNFYGIGFRMVSGDADAVAFASDLSIGRREISITNNDQTYTMSSLEFFKLGLGAEIRLSTLFVLSPMFTVSTGSMTDASGNVRYSAQGSGDGITEPRFKDGESIEDSRRYVVLGLGVGAHFDLFGE